MMCVTISACATTEQRQALSVAVPDDCERVLQPVAPAVVTKGANFRVLFRRQTANLAVANTTINEGRACVERQRQLYQVVR